MALRCRNVRGRKCREYQLIIIRTAAPPSQRGRLAAVDYADAYNHDVDMEYDYRAAADYCRAGIVYDTIYLITQKLSARHADVDAARSYAAAAHAWRCSSGRHELVCVHDLPLCGGDSATLMAHEARRRSSSCRARLARHLEK